MENGDSATASVGGTLRGHRERRRWTQPELARRAGIGVRTLRNIERGTGGRPRPDSVRRLADALGVPAGERDRLLGALRDAGRPADRGRLELGVLGPLVVRRGDRPVGPWSPMQRCVLGLLALRRGQPASRDEIIDVLWGDVPPRSCRNLVHVYVGQVRRHLEPRRGPRAPARIVVAVPAGYRLELGPHRLDLARFDELVDAAAGARDGGDPEGAYRLLEQALRCWRGAVLADGPARLRQHPAAVAVQQRRLSAALRLADTAAELGRHQQTVAWLSALAGEEPLHEGLHARLMTALAATGQQAAALRLYTDLRTRLDTDLGVTPGPDLTTAHLHVLRQHPPATTANTPTWEPVTGATGAAPTGGAGAAGPRDAGGVVPLAVPAQLPTDPAEFTGRDPELRRLDGLAGRPGKGAAVLLVAGTAGVGKSALAVRWAHRAAGRFPDGQLYADLAAPGAAAGDVLSAFLEALGVAARRVPASVQARVGLYRSLLAGRRVLVVLDNAGGTGQVRPLLPTSAGCLVLVTARHQLVDLIALDGARSLTLDVLPAAAARLLLIRRLGADRVYGQPDAVDRIVHRCAGLPLALSIVAARAAARPRLPLAELVGELGDVPGVLDAFVGGTAATDLRAAFRASYRTLGPDAARLFRLLGLVGPDTGAGPEAGVDVAPGELAAAAGLPPRRVHDLLTELARAHLVTERRPGRYAMHGLLRAYAAELLDTAPC
jgi:DNA-binding SARP family transcriptional activator/DNA-binding XRE family transcriptional regulator/DNA-binding transcriptional ArsR family regulator